MADTSPVRKSARRRAADKKYTNDAFEGLNLDILSSDSEKEAIKIEKLQDNKNDDDFPADALQEPDEEGEEDTVADSVAENMSDGSAIQTPVEVYEDAHSYASSDGIEPLTLASNTTKPKGQIRTTKGDSNVHSRGMPENPLKKDDWKDRPYLLAGSGVEDVAHILNSREQWASDPILPRKTKMCHSFSHTKEKRRMEATVGWDWYYAQGGREAFAKKQKVRILNSDDGARYVPRPTQRSHSFLMGPYGDQKLFTLSPLQTVELDETWNSASTASSGQPNQTVHGSIRGRRHGWILNVGANVKCMDWATNCDGDKQYLALSTAQIKASSPQKEPPAFTPAPPTPSCIQIWAFPSTTDSNSSLDSSRLPALRLVLCTEWGGAKQLKWCPMPRKIRDQETIGKLFVGLLAGVWTDGYVRVLEVQLDQMEAATTIYRKFFLLAW
ncbi:hypothetical protein MMC28_000791 [Mycoblastus sanguinarius]|nr:hypothetical protein [Mycoblastus sanguinarius]